ncbi:MAG: hypothetical protein JSW07_15285 [bacterium]|nr:MAG: hypothetical protein JSW07_15285 [bacterium]
MAEQLSLIEQERRKEEEEAKKKASRGKRSPELIADFKKHGYMEGRYAEGWYFPLPKSFRDELDIKYMARKEPVLDKSGKQVIEEVRDKKGRIKKKKKSKTVMRWTQGNYYDFEEGQVVYDNPGAYEDPEGKISEEKYTWKEAIKHFNLRVEVVRASPNTIDSDGSFKQGFVTFTLSKPNPKKISLEHIGQYHLTQTDFVDFLKTGRLKVDLEYLLDLLKKAKD